MLSLPTLPTDSLYKFVFVAGVLITISSFIWESQKFPTYYDDIVRLDSTAYNIDVKSKLISKDLNEFETNPIIKTQTDYLDTIRFYTNKYKQKGLSDNEYFKLENIIMALDKKEIKYYALNKNRFDSLTQNINKSKERFYNLKAGSKLLEDKLAILRETFTSQYTLEIILIIMGTFYACLGGLLWYNRIQIFQDKILKMQTAKLESEMNDNLKISGRQHFEPKIFPNKRVIRKTENS